MAEKIFKEVFCEKVNHIKVCTTTADMNFDNYTEPGTYEIYEDMGNGKVRLYQMAVDRSASGDCVTQTRMYCGKIEYRQADGSGKWGEWAGGENMDGIIARIAEVENYNRAQDGDISMLKTDIDDNTSRLDTVESNLKKWGQFNPESVNDISECTDPSKLYVLPDGYIYEYMLTTGEEKVIPNFTNQIPISTDANGNVYNGKGFKEDTYLSSGVEGAKTGYVTTGFIPVNADLATDYNGSHIVLHIKNTEFDGTSAYTRISYFDADKNHIAQQAMSTAFKNVEQDSAHQNTYVVGDDGYVASMDIGDYVYYWLKTSSPKRVAFIRLCGVGIDENSIITVNEEITYTTVEGGTHYEWVNTGHIFVPEDYGDRIANAEKKIAKNTADIANLTVSNAVTPVAVQDAASDLVDKAMSREGNRILRFLISSDAHQDDDNNLITKGNIELGQAHEEILKMIGVDFVANLGDIAWGAHTETTEEIAEQIKSFNRLMSAAVKGETMLYVEGNHDDANYSTTDSDGDGNISSAKKLSAAAVHSLIWSKNKGVVKDPEHWVDGYCYKDFEDLKVRVIVLNAEQGTGDGGFIEGYQLKWFAETALDMTGKSDWSVITLAHHPLDYPMISLCRDAMTIVEAFVNGANLNFTTYTEKLPISVDFSGRNCQYVGHFHGHAHAFSVTKLRKYENCGENSAYTELNAPQICIPNACYGRTNQYVNKANTRFSRYSTETSYNKSDVDGKRTSFNLVTVCLDEKKIYADNYGAGVDREIDY